MNDFKILAAIRDNGGTIGFVDLLNQGLSDPEPNAVADRHRILNLLSENYISGNPDAYGTIRIEPRGTVFLDRLEESLKQLDQDRAEKTAKEKRERKFSVMLVVLTELMSFALGFLTHILVS